MIRADVEFKRLPEASLVDLAELFNHPDVRRHLPLAKGRFTAERCARFVVEKERLWDEHGFGPWAFFVEGRFAGWGGLQPEGPEADFGLVLHPRYWGLGPALTVEILRRAFEEMGRDSVTVLLPPSRTRVRALKRMGFERDGSVSSGGERFARYRKRRAPASPGVGDLDVSTFVDISSRMSTDSLQQEALLQRFQAVGEETRFRIVRLLGEREWCVCELQGALDAAQSRLSFHLKKLKDAGVVSDRRDGRWVYYSLVPGALEEMREFLDAVKPPEGWLPVVRGGDTCC